MEYQKIKNLINNTPNQPSKCYDKNWVEINDDSHGTYKPILTLNSKLQC